MKYIYYCKICKNTSISLNKEMKTCCYDDNNLRKLYIIK